MSFLACSGRRMTAQLDTISQLADSSADSALAILGQYEREKPNWSKGDRMYFELVKLKAQNKAFATFTTDTIIKEVVDYFKNHGTANERMLAYYLQGRVYADMNEAPQALQAYYDAIESADTTNSDCDYQTLIPVYGQMSTLFHQQSLPHDEIWALQHYIDYIRRYNSAKDYINERHQLIRPYYLLGKKDSVLQIINDTYKALNEMGEAQEAAEALVVSINIYIERGQLDMARKNMELFEKGSGLFDKNGDIAKGREHYYDTKGLYGLATNAIDSAEYYFRKEIKYGYRCDGYRGLLNVYRVRNVSDSIAHYSLLFEAAIDSLNNQKEIDAIHRMSSLYNYNRSQKEAEQERNRAQKYQDILYRCMNILVILVIVIICIGYLFVKNKKEKRNKIINLRERLKAAKNQRIMIQDELESLKSKDYASVIAKKEQQEAELTKRIDQLLAENNQYKNSSVNNQEDDFKGFCDCYTAGLFVRKAAHKTERMIPNEAEWKFLISEFAKYAPHTFQRFSTNNTKPLSDLEQRICLLLILDIQEKIICTMVESTPSTISNAKARANEKLFGQRQAGTLKNNLIMAFKGL